MLTQFQVDLRIDNCYVKLGMSDKLKMLEFYHRASSKFLCRFPATVSTKEVRRFYRKQNAILFTLFVDLYVLCMVLLIVCYLKMKPLYIWLLYFASVLSGVLIVHIGKRHLLELDEILILRKSPEVRVRAFQSYIVLMIVYVACNRPHAASFGKREFRAANLCVKLSHWSDIKYFNTC